MGATVTNGPFAMPMMRRAVPRRLQPWLYVFMAVTFQLSGGLYLGTMAEMMGETAMTREDLLMCLYANLAGMAVYFPILFRMKFRFTNKTLLAAAATGVMACNLAAPHISFLPLLWAVCFVEGVCKIQGAFECMSTIQLWMTPNRDFTVFFPMLHIVILGSMQVADIAATTLMHHYHWTAMHWLVAGLMMADLLIITLCTRHVRIVKKFPLVGIDWLGALLWALLLLEVAYMLAYGDYHDWGGQPCDDGGGGRGGCDPGGMRGPYAPHSPPVHRTADVDLQALGGHTAAHHSGRDAPGGRALARGSVL